MYNRYSPTNSGFVYQRTDDHPTLTWLLTANKLVARRRELYRKPNDEEQMLQMRQPVSAAKAYAILGLLIGALPPAAIFTRLFGYGLGADSLFKVHADGALFFICLLMNVACCMGGYALGFAFGRTALNVERRSLVRMIVLMPLLGAAWGALTGVAGGFFYFFFGAFFGWAFGIPVGIVGFLVFAIFHRAIERGGMIEASHLAPLAFGIAATIGSFILGL